MSEREHHGSALSATTMARKENGAMENLRSKVRGEWEAPIYDCGSRRAPCEPLLAEIVGDGDRTLERSGGERKALRLGF